MVLEIIMGSPGEYKKKTPTPTTVTQGYNFPRTQEMEARSADYFSETGTAKPTVTPPNLMPQTEKPPSSYLEKQMAKRGLDPDELPQAVIGNPADWMKLAEPVGKVFDWLQVPTLINTWNIMANTYTYGPPPLMGEGTMLVDPKYNTDLSDKIQASYIAKGNKSTDSIDGLKEYNPVDYAQSIKDVMGPDIPGWMQGTLEITGDPLLASPTKVYLPYALSQAVPKAPKYIPNIVGGADWLKPFSESGRIVSQEATEATRYIDDLVRKAELADQSAKNAGTELTPPGVKIPTGSVPTPDNNSVHRLVQKMKEAKPLTKQQKINIRKEKFARIASLESELLGQMDAYIANTGDTEAGAFKDLISRKLAGEYEKVEFAPLLDEVGEGGSVFTQADYDELARYVRHNTEGFNYVKTMQALIGMVEGGAVPPPSEIKRLEDLFGTEFADLVFDKSRSKFAQGFDAVIDIAGIPRTVMSSFDLSAPLRQGRILGAEYPQEFGDAWVAMHKAMASETGAVAIEQGIKNHPLYKYAEASDLFYAERGSKYGTNVTEEAFASRWAAKMPGIKMSERAYTTFLNKFRHDVFFRTVAEWQAQNLSKSADDYRDLAQMINWSTGRGPSPFGKSVLGDRVAKIANVAFFAPRFTMSGPAFVFGGAAKAAMNHNSSASKFWANSMVSFMQSSMMWLHQIQVAGGDVELDPRSSDFGKGKFGKERFDFFGGYLPMARYLAQITTGQGKGLSSGEIYKKDRLETLQRWIRSKLSPTGGLGYDLHSGTDFLGQEFDWQQSGAEEWIQRLAPMIVGDIMDAMTLDDGKIGWNDPKELINNPRSLAGFTFSIYGGGYQAFEITKDLQDELSWQHYQKFYDELTPSETREIDGSTVMREHYREKREAMPRQSGEDQWRDDVSDYHTYKDRVLYGNPEEGTAGAISIINSLPTGREQADQIKNFKSDIFSAWESNVGPEAEQWNEAQKLAMGQASIVELLRDKFWSIQAKPMKINGIDRTVLNFDDRDREREDLLNLAANMGYITRLDNGKINPDDETFQEIIEEYPFASKLETDPERIKFSQILQDYDNDIRFLSENYYGTKKEAIGRTPGVNWDQWMAYQLNPGQDLLPFMNSSWDELTKTLNIAEKQKRQIGWHEDYPVTGQHPFTEENANIAFEITRRLVKWGRLDITDGSIPPSLKEILMPLFMEQNKEEMQPYIMR